MDRKDKWDQLLARESEATYQISNLYKAKRLITQEKNKIKDEYTKEGWRYQKEKWVDCNEIFKKYPMLVELNHDSVYGTMCKIAMGEIDADPGDFFKDAVFMVYNRAYDSDIGIDVCSMVLWYSGFGYNDDQQMEIRRFWNKVFHNVADARC